MSSRRCCCLLVALCFASGLARPVAAQNAAAPAFNPANGHWYQLVRAPAAVNWTDADAAAESLFYAGYRGHLATVTSAAEDQFVAGYLGASGPLVAAWIGGYQDTTAPDYSEPAGGWRWVTGEPWSYTNWNSGEPNNAGGAENHLETYSNGTWNDTDGPATNAYLVEYEPPAAPGAPRLSILPNPVTGGQTTIGQVILDRPAAPDDVVVTLASGSAATAAVPMVVLVPFGATTATFSIVTEKPFLVRRHRSPRLQPWGGSSPRPDMTG